MASAMPASSVAADFAQALKKRSEESLAPDAQLQESTGPAKREEAAPTLVEAVLDAETETLPGTPKPHMEDESEISPFVSLFRCRKCKRQVPSEHLPTTSLPAAGGEITCKPCLSKQATLSKMFGSWPIPDYEDLSSEEQNAFWQGGNTRGAILDSLTKSVADSTERARIRAQGGGYYPLTWYETQGFDSTRIKQNCDDIEEHAVLGTCYRVEITSITRTDTEKLVKQRLRDMIEKNKEKVSANDVVPKENVADDDKDAVDKTKKKKKDKKKNKKDKKKRKRASSSSRSSSSSSKSSKSSSKSSKASKEESDDADGTIWVQTRADRKHQASMGTNIFKCSNSGPRLSNT